MLTAVQVCDVHKHYQVHERQAGVRAAIRGLVRRQMRQIRAVDGISFVIAQGEVVGFLGPNGAGKTTTLKMLSGLLHPTCGEMEVLGYVPFRREKAFLRQMTLIMGQRNQLLWDVPAIDSFEVNRAIYRIPRDVYRRQLDELSDMLALGALLHKPVRNLSLGERMKCEMAAALLHRPSVLFLDEPTLGLDITMQRRLRDFIGAYNRQHGATVLLTSHYMADVEALCRRVLVIHHGRLVFDGDLTELVHRVAPYKLVTVELGEGAANLSAYGEIAAAVGGRVTIRVSQADTAHVTARLLADLPIADLTVSDPPIDAVIEHVFAEEAS